MSGGLSEVSVEIWGDAVLQEANKMHINRIRRRFGWVINFTSKMKVLLYLSRVDLPGLDHLVNLQCHQIACNVRRHTGAAQMVAQQVTQLAILAARHPAWE